VHDLPVGQGCRIGWNRDCFASLTFTVTLCVNMCISDASDRAPYRGVRFRCIITFPRNSVFQRLSTQSEAPGRKERESRNRGTPNTAGTHCSNRISIVHHICVFLGARENNHLALATLRKADTSALKGLFGPNESPACSGTGARLKSHLQP